MKKFYTERHEAARPRTVETLNDPVKNVLLNLVSSRIEKNWFGLSFPEKCPDGHPYAGTDLKKLETAMQGYDLIWPLEIDQESLPSEGKIFDLLEYSYEVIAEPKDPKRHPYFRHFHYDFDQESGRSQFTADVNRVFERNGIIFELKDGEVFRPAPGILHESLEMTVFRTGDDILDGLLETSRQKFLHRDLDVRRESLEKLWDAWERLKTIEPGKDKRTSVKMLLDKAASEPNFRERIEKEANELTEIGNNFMIRHTEIGKMPIRESVQVDYLFHRMFALIRLLLVMSGRVG